MPRFILLMALVAAMAGCSSGDDTEAIHALIRQGTQLAEDKQIGQLMGLTADGFTALPGNYDALSVRGILFRAFMHYGRFRILHPRPSVAVQSESGDASAVIHFLIVRQDQEMPGLKALYDDPAQWLDTAGEMADLYRLELWLKKSDSAWRVIRAHLQGFTGTGF